MYARERIIFAPVGWTPSRLIEGLDALPSFRSDEPMKYAMRSPLATEQLQEYKASPAMCVEPRASASAVQLADNGEGFQVTDELSLLKAINQQPVVMYMAIDGEDIKLYKGGVYDPPADLCETSRISPNHAMLIVVSICAWTLWHPLILASDREGLLYLLVYFSSPL